MQRIMALIESTGDYGLAALGQAMMLAERDESAPEVLAVHHIYDVPAQIEKMFHGTYLKNFTRPLLQEAEKWLQDAVRPYAEHRVRSTGAEIPIASEVIWESRAYRTVSQVHARSPADLVIKVADQRSRWLEWLLHTDDWHILTHAPTEVLMIESPVTFEHGKLLVALDSFDPAHEALNNRILSRAVALSNAFDMQLRILHAYPDINTLPNYGLELGSYVSDEMLTEIEERHREATQNLVRPFGLPSQSTVVAPGPAAMLIADQVESFKPDCLMVGNLHEKGIAGLMAHKPLNRLKSSVEGCGLWVVPGLASERN